MRGLRGPIAQLGERRVRNAEVVSSILIRSTTHSVQGSLLRENVAGCFVLCAALGRSDLSRMKRLAAADSRPMEPMTAARPERSLAVGAAFVGNPPRTRRLSTQTAATSGTAH